MTSRFWDLFIDSLGLVAGLAVLFIAGSVSAEVIWRALGFRAFGWTLEVTEYLLSVATFLGAPWVLRRADHVRVDMLLNMLPQPFRRISGGMVELLAGLLCFVLAYYGFQVAQDAFERGSMLYKRLVIPQWPILMVMPVGVTVLALEFIRRAFVILSGREASHAGEIL